MRLQTWALVESVAKRGYGTCVRECRASEFGGKDDEEERMRGRYLVKLIPNPTTIFTIQVEHSSRGPLITAGAPRTILDSTHRTLNAHCKRGQRSLCEPRRGETQRGEYDALCSAVTA
jgi:hypothetical protein